MTKINRCSQQAQNFVSSDVLGTALIDGNKFNAKNLTRAERVAVETLFSGFSNENRVVISLNSADASTINQDSTDASTINQAPIVLGCDRKRSTRQVSITKSTPPIAIQKTKAKAAKKINSVVINNPSLLNQEVEKHDTLKREKGTVVAYATRSKSKIIDLTQDSSTNSQIIDLT